MTRHLSPEDTVAAIDGTLDSERVAHLDACDQCQCDVAALGAILRDVEATSDAAEPSPLFWDHLSARVRDAVGTEAPARTPVWRHWWQPALGLAAASLFAVWLISHDTGDGPTSGQAGVDSSGGDLVAAAPDAPWDAIVELAADLSVDEVDGALRLNTIALFDELTPEEQKTLGELLRAELKGLE